MSSKEGGGKKQTVDLQQCAAMRAAANGGDEKIIAIINQLLGAAKQPPRTRVRLRIDDIYYLLDMVCEVFKSKPALVEIEVSVFFLLFCCCKKNNYKIFDHPHRFSNDLKNLVSVLVMICSPSKGTRDHLW